MLLSVNSIFKLLIVLLAISSAKLILKYFPDLFDILNSSIIIFNNYKLFDLVLTGRFLAYRSAYCFLENIITDLLYNFGLL
jgi:hypothetical protein